MNSVLTAILTDESARTNTAIKALFRKSIEVAQPWSPW